MTTPTSVVILTSSLGSGEVNKYQGSCLPVPGHGLKAPNAAALLNLSRSGVFWVVPSGHLICATNIGRKAGKAFTAIYLPPESPF